MSFGISSPVDVTRVGGPVGDVYNRGLDWGSSLVGSLSNRVSQGPKSGRNHDSVVGIRVHGPTVGSCVRGQDGSGSGLGRYGGTSDLGHRYVR